MDIFLYQLFRSESIQTQLDNMSDISAKGNLECIGLSKDFLKTLAMKHLNLVCCYCWSKARLESIIYKERSDKPGLVTPMSEAEGKPARNIKIRGIDGQDLSPSVEVSRNRGHSFKVKGARFKGDVWCRFFFF